MRSRVEAIGIAVLATAAAASWIGVVILMAHFVWKYW
jgi:hypothetical protein